MKRRPYSVYWRKPEPVLQAWKVWVRPDAFTVGWDTPSETATASFTRAVLVKMRAAYKTIKWQAPDDRPKPTKKPPAKSG